MMKRTSFLQPVKSHQIYAVGHKDNGNRYGRNYHNDYRKNAFGGWGISVYQWKKNRLFYPRTVSSAQDVARRPTEAPLCEASRTLSPHWRPFALDDGGVLFLHPSHEQLMRFNQDILKKEGEAVGQTNVDHHVNAKIESILADSTIESRSLSYWRRKQMWSLIRSQRQQRSPVLYEHLVGK